MPLSPEEQRARYLALQKILEKRHRRPFSDAETAEIGRGLVKLVTVLGTIQHRMSQEQVSKDCEKDSSI